MHYLTCQKGNSDKFYEIVAEGANVTVRCGRSGTEGVSSLKSFPSAAEANEFVNRTVAEKIKKGYVAVTRPGAGAGGKRAAEEQAPKAATSAKKGKVERPVAAIVEKQVAAAENIEPEPEVVPLSKTVTGCSSASASEVADKEVAVKREEVDEEREATLSRNVRIFS